MNAVKIAAIVLIVAGILGLVVRQFQLHEGDTRGEAGIDRAVGEGEGDGQRPECGLAWGDRDWRRDPADGDPGELDDVVAHACPFAQTG